MTYELKRTLTANAAGKFFYQVIDENGTVLTTRRSNREYVACTINGQYYFGRLDLIGKGDHGKQLRWCQQNGQQVTPIAYLNNSPVEIV